jgi:autotransporter translocation and assembly factor TamB
MRAAARVVGFVSGSLVLVASVLLTALTMWLHTAAGRHWLEREASQGLALTVTIGRIHGSVIGGIRLDDVAVQDPRGRLVAQADTLSVRYRVHRLARF